jgi:NAD(P)-dependent dehydrogenase (short-subunit alcohol dehydrogenase family)
MPAKQGIRVNSVAPGVVDTDMLDRVVDDGNDEIPPTLKPWDQK